MVKPCIVIAGTGFRVAGDYLDTALPDARIDIVDLTTIRKEGISADVLIPAMSRIDGPMMDCQIQE